MKKLLKFIYKHLPLKFYIFSFIRYFWIPPKSIYQHLYFNRVFKVRLDKNHSFKIRHYGFEIENEIFWKGIRSGWEKESVNLWIKLCQNSSVILDVGANTGIYALIAKAINPSAKVIAFEPVRRVFDKLIYNNSINKYEIECINMAASNYDGEATIYDTMGDHILSVTVNKNIHNPSVEVKPQTINVTKLSTYFRNNNILKPDLLKIDVETHEPETLDGLEEYMWKFKPTMLIEVLNDDVAEEIEKRISNLNYLYFNIDENKGIRLVNSLSKSDTFNYLICSSDTAKEIEII